MNRMKLSVLLAAAACATVGMAAPAAAGTAAAVPVLRAASEGVPGQYIVTLKEQAGVQSARSLAADLNVTPRHVYTAALNGFSASLSAAQLTALQHSPAVARIEQNAKVHTDGTQSGATWGIDRIDQPTLPLSGTYSWNADGTGATAYIIDTGIDASHPDFTGRAQIAFDATGGNGVDCNGHGTHVAGTIGGATWGVAKNVALRGVRVLDCGGSGTWEAVIAGMDWVTANHAPSAVANMSLGGGLNQSVNDAATRMADSGVFTGIAAGNSSADACSFSPASAANVTTVAASDSSDAHAFFSNFGSCVEVYAPGVDVTSSWMGGGTNTISGTSMATPHVVGIGALYKSSQGDVASATLNGWIQAASSPNVISGVPAGTPNLLAQTAGL
ncbi:MAG TPA: S8 family peptidase [Actinophytocola sp.]|jgi:subtilisin family serine protease|nr:S8 family peptidase [Actinophytocola sp.]